MAENKRDYYEVLGVDRGADEATLKKAYRKLARSTILILIREIKRRRKNLRKPRKPTVF